MLLKRLRGCRSWILTAVALAGVAALARAQGRVDDALLNRKRLFAEQQLAALAQPFVGVHTAAGVAPGLFPIRATGVSTAPIVDAANAFLAALTPTQTIRTIFAVDDAEWRRWSNVDNGLYTRQGVSLREMSAPQRDAAMALLRASLSAKGLALSQDIMKTDQVLREVNDDALRYDEQLYFLTIMGRPSATEPWGWQIDGHHLIVNCFVLGDQVVMTPVFMGARTRGGDHRQVRWQRRHAARAGSGSRLHAGPRRDPAAGGARSGATSPPTTSRPRPTATTWSSTIAACKASTLAAPLKAQLLALAGLYIGTLRDAHAAVRMREVARAPRRHLVRLGRRRQ